MKPALHEQIIACHALPTLPAAAVRLLEVLSNDMVDVIEISKIISRDPALSARVLRTVNSPLYGVPQRVSTLSQAVVLLGLQAVKTLALGFSLTFNLRNEGGFKHLEYWRRSMYSATAAKVIAGRLLGEHEEDCFIAALLMDIGCLVLHKLLRDQYDMLCAEAQSHADLPALEKQKLGITHMDVAKILAAHWKLPDVLALPMASHHAPQEVTHLVSRRIVQVIALAGRCADVFVNKGKTAESIASVRNALLTDHGLDLSQADALMCVIGQQTAGVAMMFDVKLNSNANYEQILASASEQLKALPPVTAEAPKERRRAARKPRSMMILIRMYVDGMPGNPIRVRLRDTSATGMGFLHTDRIESGSQFIIQLPDQGKVKTMLYTVVRQQQDREGWIIGATFNSVLKTNDEKIMTMAG